VEAALPDDAFYVPPAQQSELQRMLVEHRRVRLQPGGNYMQATGIEVRSGQALYGAAGTRIGRIVVTPGTTGFILSGVIPAALEFPPSNVPTSYNCFERFAARSFDQKPLTLRNVSLHHNLFLDAGQIIIDTEFSGRVENNRFIRTLVHTASPVLKMTGHPGGGDRNIFVWMNILGPVGDAIEINHEAEVNLIGFDAENWNQRRIARSPAMLTVGDTRVLRILMPHGGDQKFDPGRFMDVEANSFELLGMRLLASARPAVVVHAAVERFWNILSTDVALTEEGAHRERLVAYLDGNEGATPPQWTSGSVAPRSSPEAPTKAWEQPSLPVPADAAEDQWRRRRGQQPDSGPELQRQLDERGLIVLPAGTFYISRPLRLHNGQAIIGAGAARTAIVAKSDDVDLIVGDDHFMDKHPTSFSLVDLTLEGGRVGIRHDEVGAGRGAQFNFCYLSHVVFRDMTQAGILISGIYGWDNNLLDHVVFERVAVGILQLPSPGYVSAEVSGDVAGMNYMDKNVCYRCRFTDLATGLRLIAKRANGLNACIECRFDNNREGALKLIHNLSTIIANSDFIDDGGDPVVSSDYPVGIAGSRFEAGSQTGSFLDNDAICEGCRFSGKEVAQASIGRRQSRVVLINSTSERVRLGDDISGLLSDTTLSADPEFRGRLLFLMGSGTRIVVPGEPRPDPKLLVEWQDPDEPVRMQQ
jgi:hypothetical protein